MSFIRPLALAVLATAAAACAADAPTVPAAPDAALAASAAKAGGPAEVNQALAAARAATARYHRVEAAVADGYVQASPCVAAPGLGGMGHHYVNFGLIDFALDPARPEALVYAPRPDGSLKLVAAEYMVPGVGAKPSLFGQTFVDAPGGAYALHAWVWEHNPSGMFADFNPSVSCPAGDAPHGAAAAAAEHAHH